MTISLRPCGQDDAAEVVDLLESIAAVDGDILPPSVEEWRTFCGMSFNHGASDFALVDVDGAASGVLMSARKPGTGADVRNFRIILHPRVRRRGVGSAVLARVEEQDPAGDTVLLAECLRSWEAGSAFLAARGFTPEQSEVWMASGDTPPPPPDVPAGMRIRPSVAGSADDACWIALTHEAYTGTPDATALSVDDLAVMRDEPGFRLHLLEDRGEVVGLCHVKEYARLPWVNNLAVTAVRRGEGLGRLLLLDMLAAIGRDVGGEVRLTVRADNAPARRLYEASGFRTVDMSRKWWRHRS